MKLLRSTFFRALLVVVAVFLFVRFGIHPPAPWSVVTLYMAITALAVFIYVFDLLELEGEDLTALPLRERKALLKKNLEFHGPVRFTPHHNEKGQKLFLEACRKGGAQNLSLATDKPEVR